MSAPARHGHACRGQHSGTYRSWRSMLYRCERPYHPHFANYGGKGIAVCARWHSFDAFLSDMGERPPETTLERKNNAIGYEPGNCRWATRTEQQNNRGDFNVRLVYRGEDLTLAEWSRRTGIKEITLRQRVKNGWSADRALTTPVRAVSQEWRRNRNA